MTISKEKICGILDIEPNVYDALSYQDIRFLLNQNVNRAFYAGFKRRQEITSIMLEDGANVWFEIGAQVERSIDDWLSIGHAKVEIDDRLDYYFNACHACEIALGSTVGSGNICDHCLLDIISCGYRFSEYGRVAKAMFKYKRLRTRYRLRRFREHARRIEKAHIDTLAKMMIKME